MCTLSTRYLWHMTDKYVVGPHKWSLASVYGSLMNTWSSEDNKSLINSSFSRLCFLVKWSTLVQHVCFGSPPSETFLAHHNSIVSSSSASGPLVFEASSLLEIRRAEFSLFKVSDTTLWNTWLHEEYYCLSSGTMIVLCFYSRFTPFSDSGLYFRIWYWLRIHSQ